jgi:hypothetical protein
VVKIENNNISKKRGNLPERIDKNE